MVLCFFLNSFLVVYLCIEGLNVSNVSDIFYFIRFMKNNNKLKCLFVNINNCLRMIMVNK